MTGAGRREQILDVTEAIVETDGFHAVSIDRVAREAGITRPVVYTHFGDLQGLLHALVDRGNERTLEALARIVPTEPGGRPELLLDSLRQFLETVRDDPATWRLALLPPQSAPRVLAERIARDRANVVRALAAVVDPWVAGEADPSFVARWLVAIAEESARIVLEDPDAIDRVLGTAIRVLPPAAPGVT
jgi:AcrR family transcriptional regulator